MAQIPRKFNSSYNVDISAYKRYNVSIYTDSSNNLYQKVLSYDRTQVARSNVH